MSVLRVGASACAEKSNRDLPHETFIPVQIGSHGPVYLFNPRGAPVCLSPAPFLVPCAPEGSLGRVCASVYENSVHVSVWVRGVRPAALNVS